MFNPNVKYMFYAEDFEEIIVAPYREGDHSMSIEEYDFFVEDYAEQGGEDMARMILSELRLPFDGIDPIKDLIDHYQREETRDAVFDSWGVTLA